MRAWIYVWVLFRSHFLKQRPLLRLHLHPINMPFLYILCLGAALHERCIFLSMLHQNIHSPYVPPGPLRPKHSLRRHPDSRLMVRTAAAAASRLSSHLHLHLRRHPPTPSPPSLCPLRITLCGRRALCRTCIHQRRGQGTTLDPLVFARAHLCPCRFEEPCCWPVGNRSGAGVRVGVQTPSCIFHETLILSTLVHTYTHRMYRCCSFLPHLFLDRKNFRSRFLLGHPLPKFNSLAWRQCQIVSLKARLPLLFLWQRWTGAFWTQPWIIYPCRDQVLHVQPWSRLIVNQSGELLWTHH